MERQEVEPVGDEEEASQLLERYAEVELSGLGSMQSPAGVVPVMLLRPKGLAHPVLPVFLPLPMGQIYRPRLEKVLQSGVEPDSLFTDYLDLSGIRIPGILVTLERADDGKTFRVVTSVSLEDPEGVRKRFRTPMEDALVRAVLAGLPIYVDREIITMVDQHVSYSFAGPDGSEMDRQQSLVAQVEELIRTGRRPEELPVFFRRLFYRTTGPEEWHRLEELAVRTENYEWAALLQDMLRGGAEEPYETDE